MVKIRDKVKFTQAKSPFAEPQTFDGEVLSVDENQIAHLQITLPNGSTSEVFSVVSFSQNDSGDVPTYQPA